MMDTAWSTVAIIGTLLILSLLFPMGRSLVAGIFGKAFMPVMAAALEAVFRWMVHFLKMAFRYVWVILKNLITPKKRIYRTLDDNPNPGSPKE